MADRGLLLLTIGMSTKKAIAAPQPARPDVVPPGGALPAQRVVPQRATDRQLAHEPTVSAFVSPA